jgi:hypothetical protein
LDYYNDTFDAGEIGGSNFARTPAITAL